MHLNFGQNKRPFHSYFITIKHIEKKVQYFRKKWTKWVPFQTLILPNLKTQTTEWFALREDKKKKRMVCAKLYSIAYIHGKLTQQNHWQPNILVIWTHIIDLMTISTIKVKSNLLNKKYSPNMWCNYIAKIRKFWFEHQIENDNRILVS